VAARLTGALALAAIALASAAGCGASARQPRADASDSPATSAVSRPVPTASAARSYSGPELPNGQCPYLTTAQIQAALGQPVHHLADCAYSFANGAGSFGVTEQTYSSLRMTRTCYQEALSQARGLFPGRNFTITKIPGLQAVSLTLPHGGTQTIFLRGTKALATFVLWPPAETRPQIAIVLLREAVQNFGRYSAPVSAGCS
jgi:hypothetical protein